VARDCSAAGDKPWSACSCSGDRAVRDCSAAGDRPWSA
jgi:hypothetical protein